MNNSHRPETIMLHWDERGDEMGSRVFTHVISKSFTKKTIT